MAERTVMVRLRANVSDFNRAFGSAKRAVNDLRSEIDTTNDRTAWLAQGILGLGPALVPLGAAATPILTGLVTQMTLAGGAAGVTALAFVGVGDSLKALNEYQLEPTAANLDKMREAMNKLGPEGEHFVHFLDRVGPQFRSLQQSARGGMFPGAEEGIEHILTLLPKLNRVVRDISEGMGELFADAGAGLAGPEFEEFFNYLDQEAKPLLIEMGHTFGNFAEGLANMMVGFAPLTRDFSGGFLEMSESFASWSRTLDTNDSFQSFIAYIQDVGPMALDFLGSLIDAFVQILEAAAPVGSVLLPALTSLLDIIGTLADTPIGPIFIAGAAAMSLYGRAAALASITTGGLTAKILHNTAAMQIWTSRASTASMVTAPWGKALGQAAGGLGVMALALTDVDNKLGVANTSMGAMAGLMLGGLPGLATGALIGGIMDMSDAADETSDAIAELHRQISNLPDAVTDAQVDMLRGRIKELRDAIKADEDDGNTFGDYLETSGALLNPFDGDVWETDRLGRGLGGTDYNNTRAETKELEAAEAALEEAMGGVTFEARQQAAALKQSVAAMVSKREENLRGLNAELNYASALLDTQEGIKKNAGVLSGLTRLGDAHTEEQIEAAKLLTGQAEAWNTLNEKAQNAPGAFEAAHQALVNAAIDLGLGEKAAKRYANRVMEIPTKWATKIDMDTKSAWDEIVRFKRHLASIRDKTVELTLTTIYANSSDIGQNRGGGRDDNPYTPAADGATVPKTGLPYADRHLYLLADGEEIISNRYGQADRYRADRAAGRIPGYADGGTAGWTPPYPTGVPASVMSQVTGTSARFDMDMVAAVARNTRPLIEGGVTIEAHDMKDIRRDFANTKALAGMDRVRSSRGSDGGHQR